MKIDFDGGHSVEGGFTVMWWSSQYAFDDSEPDTATDVMIFTHKESMKSAASYVPRLLNELSKKEKWDELETDLLMCAVGKYVDAH